MNIKSKKPEKMWYDPVKLLSYNKMVNFVMSQRGGGKTYSCKKMAIKNFLKSGEQFIYLRRYKTELKGNNISKFFDDISVEFPGHEFEVKGHGFYIDGKCAGYCYALTQQAQVKSTPFPNVTLIIFDEFVIDDRGTKIKYIQDEVKDFLEFVSTVTRNRDNVRILCCANSISYVNPYFDFWKIRINADDKREFYFSPVSDQVILQLFDSKIFAEKMLTTRFGKLIAGTEYGNYAINNTVLLDSNEFILDHKPQDSQFQFSLKYDDKIIGCWFSESEQIYHFNYQYDPDSKYKFSVTTDDHAVDYTSIKSMKNNSFMKTLKLYYNQGLVFYVDQEIKKDMLNIFKFIGI